MELKVKYSNRFKRGLRLAAKRGLDTTLLEYVVVKLKSRIPLDVKYKELFTISRTFFNLAL